MTFSPSLLRPFIAAVAQTCDVRALAAASARIHRKYTTASREPLEGIAEHAAYVVCRMPATLAATLQALAHVREVIPHFCPTSVLDIGSGPGTALLGSVLSFPSVTRALGLERSPEFCSFSEKLFSEIPAMHACCHVQRCDVERSLPCEGAFDMVISSYAFGELSKKAQERWLAAAKERARVVVLIEPGTPAGWQCLMRCRDILLAQGASLLAPCPHAKLCPFTGSDAWCHEAVRVQRSSLHRRLKGGTLGYEDEKLSYVAATFDPLLSRTVPPCRIVHAPRHRHGHTHLVACTYRGALEPIIISRKHGSLYRLAREAKWGDALPTMVQNKIQEAL